MQNTWYQLDENVVLLSESSWCTTAHELKPGMSAIKNKFSENGSAEKLSVEKRLDLMEEYSFYEASND